MLTDAQVYCMTSMIYLFRLPLTAKAIYMKTAEAKLYTQYIYYIAAILHRNISKDGHFTVAKLQFTQRSDSRHLLSISSTNNVDNIIQRYLTA